MKAKDGLVARCREERINLMVKIYFLTLQANRFWLTSKSCPWFNKVVYSPLLPNGLHKKGMTYY